MHATLLYDGHCRFCSSSARQLHRLAHGRVTIESFREPEVIARFPSVTPEAAEKAIHLVRDDGRVYRAAEALVHTLRGRWFGAFLFVYYVPGLRTLIDLAYRLIARYRFKIAGRTCEGGTCHLHV